MSSRLFALPFMMSVICLSMLPIQLHAEITYIEFGFESGKKVEVVDQGQTLVAEIRVAHSGSEFLNGEWQIATPPSTHGTPVFITLEYIQQMLAGKNETILQSPSLPTDQPGLYLLKIHLLDTQLSGHIKPLRYQVIK